MTKGPKGSGRGGVPGLLGIKLPQSRSTGPMKFLARLILRHSLAVIIIGILITVPCLYWTKQLYGNLKPDIEELLPRQSRSIQDLTEIRQRLQSIENLAVLIFNDDPEAAKRFSIDLANKLGKLSPNVAAGVEYRIDKELTFFDQ